MNLEQMCKSLRNASVITATLSAEQKNLALRAVAKALVAQKQQILDANAQDVARAKASGTKESLVDRLLLTDERINAMAQSIELIASQTDPIGEQVAGWMTPNALQIRQVRVPLGVVAIIYESRPNVTVDAFALAYKSGNAILLRGSKVALQSNNAIVNVIKNALANTIDGVADAINLSTSETHEDVEWILNAVGKIDVVLPRGGKNLIESVVRNARVPVIETGSGVCHLFVDESANIKDAVRIAENGKIQRPGVCNALETVLVHRTCAKEFLCQMVNQFAGRVELRCDKESFDIVNNYLATLCAGARADGNGADKSALANSNASANANARATKVCLATDSDFGFEFLDTILAVKIVSSIEEAVLHINTHNTKHSESIITQNYQNAKFFQDKVDASCVYVNASTRFTDGGEFGFGAELGISTQKLHARGPMGLSALTTTKYLIDGKGQIR